jgi:hypothetical protein
VFFVPEAEMNVLSSLAGFVVGFSLVSSGAAALADTPKQKEGYEYKFTDDDVLAGDRQPLGERIHVLPLGRRDHLLRPRIHFVPEMLKSVESM